MQRSENKKITTTRFLLKKALLEYLSEKSIVEINVTMICQRAQMNRSTFYLHYHSIEDLLHKIQMEEIQQFTTFIQSFIQVSSDYEVCVKCLQYLKQHVDTYSVLLSGNYPDFEQAFIQCINRFMRKKVSYQEQTYENIFVTTGCLHISKYWIDSNFKDSAQEVANIILSIIRKHYDDTIEK